MTTEEKNIEQAAKSFIKTRYIRDDINREVFFAFTIGAKSPEAKEYWQKGMYTESEVYGLVIKAMENGYLHGIANEVYSLKYWWKKYKK